MASSPSKFECASPPATPMESPYRFVMSPSKSAPDMTVQGLVDRFNTLEVKDRDEEKIQRQIKRLEAALRRAEMAREEAETEAQNLRAEMRDVREVNEERQGEKMVLRERLDEYEKKYEKAKDRFRQQRVKHEESMRKAGTEFLEREKQHWRQSQAEEEEKEWERKLRVEAHDLLAFLDVERHFQIKFSIARSRKPSRSFESTEHMTEQAAPSHLKQSETASDDLQHMHDSVHQDEKAHDEAAEQEAPVDDAEEDPEAEQDGEAVASADEDEAEPSSIQQAEAETPSTPNRHTHVIPVDFNDDPSDKENTAPTTCPASVPSKPHLPSTPARPIAAREPSTCAIDTTSFLPGTEKIDRAAALAAIQYRRGRARSFLQGEMTPRDKMRDVSAPVTGVGLGSGMGGAALVTMTVGRKRAGA